MIEQVSDSWTVFVLKVLTFIHWHFSTDALQQGASQFEQQAGKLKNKFWWKNMKMMIIMGVIGIIVVGIIGSKFM